jgi:hypothetical protein
VFHANDPASERQLEYYRALGKKITPEIQRLTQKPRCVRNLRWLFTLAAFWGSERPGSFAD